MNSEIQWTDQYVYPRAVRWVLPLLLLLTLQGCALRVLDAVTPSRGYSLEAGLAYGDHPRQKLDYYQAKEPKADSPLIVFFYGGSWQEGYKEGYRFVAQGLAEQGYSVVVPDYRLHPEVQFPTFLEDAALAVAWVEQQFQPEHGLVLMGHSAGAHMAAMLALDEQFLNAHSIDRDRIRAWVGLSGPYDFLPLRDPALVDVFGAADGIPETQPINFVDAAAPPALLVHGTSDRLVGSFNSSNLAEAMAADGLEVDLRFYSGIRHVATVANFSVRLRGRSEVFDDVVDYLDRL
ncbi:MAG: alpha/beta hydrolase [Saccharospirillum sp.]|nr:alpha/beta hydrolase [Saccharospirillum sp.]